LSQREAAVRLESNRAFSGGWLWPLSFTLGIEHISGLFLYLHSKTQGQSLHYYQQLARLQRVSIAIRLAEAHKDPRQEQIARNLLIRELLASSRIASESLKAVSDTDTDPA
jgi:hypothetical protein